MSPQKKISIFFINSQYMAISLFLIVATCLVYGQVLEFEFVQYDDTEYVTQNPQVKAGITSASIKWAFTSIHASNWHPLTWLSHMLDVTLYGLNPGGHHLTSLLFHIANTLLVFFVFKKMTGALWPSAFTAALFALHPLHVESVAWVSERKDVLSAFFFFLTLGAYHNYVYHPTAGRYLGVILLFVLGLMSKPMLVTLPGVLLLLDVWPLQRADVAHSPKDSHAIFRKSVWWLLAEKIPFFFLSGVSSAVTFYAQQHGGAIKSLAFIPFSSRIANALTAYTGYLAKMLMPFDLAFLYPHPIVIPGWKVGGAIMILASLSVLAVVKIKKNPYIFTGWFWFLGTLVPVIGLVQVGSQAMADRYTYIPLLGIFLWMAWGWQDFVSRRRFSHQITAFIAGLVIVLCMALTWRQAGFWKNSIPLFEHALEVTSGNFIAHYNLANVLAKQGRTEEAVLHYHQTISINPDFADAYINLGNVYQMQGQTGEALSQYLQAVKRIPENAGLHYNLGLVYEKQGEIEKAIAHFQKAVVLKPDYEAAYFKLGLALFQKNDFDGAAKNFKAVLHLNPDNISAKNNLRRLLLLKQNTP